MRFECGNCGAKYKISDAKVAGRVVRFPCRKCDNKILIDGRLDDVTVPAGPAYGFEDVTRRSEPAPFGAEPATARRRPVPSARRRSSSIPPRRAASAARRMSSSPAAAASAFVGQHPGLAPPLPVGGKAEEGPFANESHDKPEWHVSINDVPIGPIRLEEMAHKVDAGAVSEYSLVWREGLDEWRPLATVPELMSLLYQRRSSGPPTRSKFSSMPPFVEAQTAIKETPDQHPPSVPPGPPKPPVHTLGAPVAMTAGSGALSVAGDAPSPSELSAAADFTPLADALQPDISLPSIPAILADLEPSDTSSSVASEPSPMLDSPSAPAAPLVERSVPNVDSVSIPVVAPQPIAQEPRGSSAVWVWVLLLGVVVFSAVAAFMVVDRFGDTLMERFLVDDTVSIAKPRAVPAPVEVAEPVEELVIEEAVAESDQAGGPTEGEPDTAAGAPIADDEPSVEDATEPVEADAPVEADDVAVPEPVKKKAAAKPAPKKQTRARRRAKPKRTAKPAAAPPPSTGIKKLGGQSGSLSAEEQQLLAKFDSGKSSGVAKISVKEQGSTSSQRDPLDSKAVSSTVTQNKPRLQRCYERAIRGQQSPTAVRMNVLINVAPSGRVSSVDVSGGGPGGLKECMEASIRRWRFPASSEGGPAKFPIVFSAN